jgi:hypothetical protein
MVALLLELGADPLGVDGWGMPVAAYAENADIDHSVMGAINRMTIAEIGSADRGRRAARGGWLDLLASVAVRDWKTAERLVRDDPSVVTTPGALHLVAKRGDVDGAKWLLDHGVDPSARWAHWETEVTPLHLAILANHRDVAQLLLDRGADPRVRDTQHNADAMGWAEFFQRHEMVKLLQARADVPRSGA